MPEIIDELLNGGVIPAEAFASELSWPDKDTSRRAGFEGCLLLTLGEEPALAIADSGEEPLAFAYHSGYEWVLDARPGHPRRLSNTRWRKDGGVYQLAIDSQVARPVIESLTPLGFEQDRPAKIAAAYKPFDAQVASLESALIKKLGDLRRLAFRMSAGDPQHLDKEIHFLITQFFVLRAIEDLGLNEAAHLPSLETVVNQGYLDADALSGIYETARQTVQADLFDHKPYKELAPAAVAYVVAALYEQDGIPGSTRLNFGWIDPDVFGRIYERYLATILREGPVPDQSSLFDVDIRGVREVTQQKQGGVYYTPQPLVRMLTARALEVACPEGLREDSLPRIADFACGSGAFLAGALDKVLKSFPVERRAEIARTIITERLLIGVDVDPRAVALARLNLYLRLAQERTMLPLPGVDKCIRVGDSLARSLPDDFDDLEYSAVLGNPPFLATDRIPDKDSLTARFATAVGRYDFSTLFLELAVRRVKDRGAIALVVPNRLFTNTSGRAARAFVVERCELDTVVDFGSAPVFEGVSAYIGLLTCRRRNDAEPRDFMRYVKVRSVPEAFELAPVAQAIFDRTGEIEGNVQAFNERQPTPGDPWNAVPPSLRLLFTKLEDDERGISLGEVADIKQGIKTRANYVFLLNQIGDFDGTMLEVEAQSGRRAFIERALLRPAATGPDVSRYRLFNGGEASVQRLLYPYDENGSISEARMIEEFPNAYQYLQGFKAELESRVSVVGSGQPWYGLVRPRDDAWLSGAKILSRDLISAPAFAVDIAAGIYLVGGTAIIPAESDTALSLLGFLNSRAFGVLLRQGASEYKGQYVKAEPGRLAQIFVPQTVIADREIADLVSARLELGSDQEAIERRIDDIVDARMVEAGR